MPRRFGIQLQPPPKSSLPLKPNVRHDCNANLALVSADSSVIIADATTDTRPDVHFEAAWPHLDGQNTPTARVISFLSALVNLPIRLSEISHMT